MNAKPLIESQNLPIWTISAFFLALLALVVATVGLYRIQLSAALTQAEVVALSRQIQETRKTVAAAPQQSAQGAAPAAPAAK